MEDKELQEFWAHFVKDHQVCIVESTGATHFETLPLDLNNLFKYAVPKLRLDIGSITLYSATKDRWGCYFSSRYQDYTVAETPALALYQAIQKAREATNAKTDKD